MQMPTLESRIASLESIQAQINERLGSIEQGQRELSNRIDNRLNSMDNRLTNMDNRNNSNFKWLVGLLVIALLANVGTAVSVIMTFSRP